MNKKKLSEVFEFFPTAQWVTENANGVIGVSFAVDKPRKFIGDTWSLVPDNIFIGNKYLKIIWPESMPTWDKRCVSRKEVMGE